MVTPRAGGNGARARLGLRCMSPAVLNLAGIALLCLMDAAIKRLSMPHSVPFVLSVSFGVRCIVTGGFWWWRGAKPISRAMWRTHALRGAFIAASVLGFFIGVARLPLAEVVTLAFLSPLLVPFVAWAWLGERPRRASIVAIGLGFVGVLIAVGGLHGGAMSAARAWGIAATLVGSALFALSIVLLRARAGADGPARTNLLGALFPALYYAPVALFAWEPVRGADWPVFAAAGVFGGAGMLFYALAYGRAQAQSLAPLEFTALLWAALIGWFGFGERPAPALFAGAAIIIAAALVAARDEARARTTLAVTPAS